MTDTVSCLVLSGSALDRGEQQALLAPDAVDRVQSAVRGRLATLERGLQRSDVQALLERQMAFVRQHDPDGYDELLGIARGFGLTHIEMIAYLHGNVIADMAQRPIGLKEADGCTAWAQSRGKDGQGALVVKNRDYRGEHGALQRVFVHRDPAWGDRSLLCLGSLGSPGAFSSGMNSDGLVVVDTQIPTSDHGPGWLRYFLMTALLRSCASVEQALEMVMAVPHAGGGSLVIGDRAGQVAAIELGHRRAPAVFCGSTWVARTNHCVHPEHQAHYLEPRDDLSDSSVLRLAAIKQRLQSAQHPLTEPEAQALMSGHASPGGVCRHAKGASSGTLACVLYDSANLTLTVSQGPPCEGRWAHLDMAGQSL